MLVRLQEDLHLDAPPEEVWKLLRDTPRLTALLPGVESVTALGEAGAEAYSATASDKIGPFKVRLNLEVRVTEAQAPSILKAALKGADSLGLNRVTGSLEVTLSPALPGTQMRFEASVEVLGKLATLGAVPMRRRTTESFAAFARNIQGAICAEQS